MKTTKTLLALIAAAAMVACSKDDISYGDLDGTYELNKITYLFDGEAVLELTPNSENWDDELYWNEFFEKIIFEGKFVTIWVDGDFFTNKYVIDNGRISFGGLPLKFKKTTQSLTLYYSYIFDTDELDDNYYPVYDDELLESADETVTYRGVEIHYDYLYDFDKLAYYYKGGKPVFCSTLEDDYDNWFDTIEYTYKKK